MAPRAIGAELPVGSAEHSADELAQLLDLALECAGAVTWQWDIATDECFWSDEFRELLGLESSTPPSYENWLASIVPEDRADVARTLHEHIQSGRDFRIEFRINHPHRGRRWLASSCRVLRDENGKPRRLIGVTSDITDSKRTEMALRDSQRLFRRIAEVTPDIVYIYDLVEHRNVYINGRIKTVLGYSEAEIRQLRGQAIRSLIHRDDLRQILGKRLVFARVSDDETIEREFRLRHADGTWRWFHNREIVFARHDDGRPRQILGLLTDVSDHHRTERALRESEERFRQLAETIDDVFWIWDPETRKVLYLSPAFESVWGMPRSRVYESTKTWFNTIHPADQARLKAALITRVESGTYDEEFRIVRPDGTVRWIRDRGFPITDGSGALLRIVGVAEDITERRRAAHALRESEERFRQFADSSQDVAWIFNVDENRLEYVSASYERIWGQSREKIMRDAGNWLDSIHIEDRDAVRAILPGIRTGEKRTFEYRIVRPDGTVRWIRNSAFPITDVHRKVHRVGGIAQDITERKQTEEELSLALSRAKLLLSEVHHRVKNSVQAITAVLRMERRATASSEAQRRIDATIRRVMAIGRVHDQLYRTEDFDVVEFGSYLRTLCDELAKSILPAGRQLDVRTQRAKVPIRVATSLGLIATELVTNAIKHGLGPIRVDFTAGGGVLRLSVADQGPGLPPDFDPDRSGGLGAQLTQSLSRLMGGQFRWIGPECIVTVPHGRQRR
ncbi:MAG TPA: PAS domain-containing protein [Alphaproteobacteria bacterium]